MIDIKTFAVKKAAAKTSPYVYYGSSGGGFGNNTSSNVAGKIEGHYLWGQYFDATQDINGDLTSNGKITSQRLKFIDGTGNTLTLQDFTASTASIISLSSTTINNSGNFFNDGDITNKGDINNLGKITTNQLEAVSGYIETLLGVDWTVENLTVTKAAHFFKLIIDEIKATQGAIIVTPANAKIDKVTQSGNNYTCYFMTTDPTTKKEIYNNFEVNDQVVCQTFNAATGTSYNVANKFYWMLCTETGTTTVDSNSYHYIKLTAADKDSKSNGVPQAGDEIVLLGSRTDKSRQNAIVISAYNSQFLDAGLKAPSIVQYSGINNYNLSSHRLNIISNGLNSFKGIFTTSDGANLEQTYKTISGDVQTNITNISSLSATSKALTSSLQSVENKVETVSGSVTTANNNIATISGNVSTNTTNISNLQQTASSLTSDISSVQTQVTTVSGSVTTANGNISSLSGKVTTNTTDISSLKQTSSSLTSSIQSTTSKVETVSGQVKTLDGTVKNVSGQVVTNTTDISTLKQTSSSLTSSIQSLENDVLKSESLIQQTADNIRLEVMSCGVDIDNKRIKLNGDTLIEGNVTVQNADVGFTLQGDGGTTQIISSSIGTLDAFKQKTTVALQYKGQTYSVGTYHSSNGKYIHNNCSIIYNLGEFKSGKVVTITGFTTTLTPSSNVSSLNNTFEFYVDGVKKSYVDMAGTSKSSWNYNYTMPSKGILQIKRILKLVTNTSAQYNISTTLTVKYSTDAYGQISYDGIGFNLGNGGRIFANKTDGIVMENNNWGIKVAPNMMYKRMPTGKTFTEDNGTVRTDTVSTTEYGLKNGLYEFNKHRTRAINSTGFLYIQPSDEIITCYVSDRSKVYVMLGDPSTRAGQHITFLNCGNVYVSPTSNGLSNETQLSNNSFVTEAYCDGVYWFLFAKNVTHMFNSSSKYSQ